MLKVEKGAVSGVLLETDWDLGRILGSRWAVVKARAERAISERLLEAYTKAAGAAVKLKGVPGVGLTLTDKWGAEQRAWFEGVMLRALTATELGPADVGIPAEVKGHQQMLAAMAQRLTRERLSDGIAKAVTVEPKYAEDGKKMLEAWLPACCKLVLDQLEQAFYATCRVRDGTDYDRQLREALSPAFLSPLSMHALQQAPLTLLLEAYIQDYALSTGQKVVDAQGAATAMFIMRLPTALHDEVRKVDALQAINKGKPLAELLAAAGAGRGHALEILHAMLAQHAPKAQVRVAAVPADEAAEAAPFASQPRGGAGQCWSCQRSGHRQQDCKEYVCPKCGKSAPGHRARDCTQGNA